ncbi:hypothetical protein [Spartinivicinus ruber]|uniref:hypothetical protein n=1 Tax=Spartinivicinus ruber TaxID=2683272 RepID=UPI0013D6B5A2|nr:hypothetical protein [Spartinivicinus ruber]
MAMLNEPSEFYRAVESSLQSILHETCFISGYSDYGRVNLSQHEAAILIEIEQAQAIQRNHDGRYGVQLDVALHIQVGRHKLQPELKSLDLAIGLARRIDCHLWGLPTQQIDYPTDIRTIPGGFDPDNSNGYESWCVLFSQTIYLGPSELEDDPPVKGVWWANNPNNPADEKEYERFHD